MIKTTMDTPVTTQMDIHHGLERNEYLREQLPEVDLLFLNYDPKTKKPTKMFITYTYENEKGVVTSAALDKQKPEETLADYIENALVTIQKHVEQIKANGGLSFPFSSSESEQPFPPPGEN